MKIPTETNGKLKACAKNLAELTTPPEPINKKIMPKTARDESFKKEFSPPLSKRSVLSPYVFVNLSCFEKATRYIKQKLI